MIFGNIVRESDANELNDIDLAAHTADPETQEGIEAIAAEV